MIQILKYAIAVVLGIYAYSHFIDVKKAEKPKTTKTIKPHQCPIDKDACKICGKKSELYGFSKPVKKEVVLFPKEGQVLSENQLSIKTPEGKEEFRKQIGWLRDICDDYALEQYQKQNGIKTGEIKK